MAYAYISPRGELTLPLGRSEDAFGQPIRAADGERLYIGPAAGAEEVLMNGESYQYWGSGPAALTFEYQEGAFMQVEPPVAKPRRRWFGWFK